eukprot:4146007-Pleurochrysis_carterae.AAC.1
MYAATVLVVRLEIVPWILQLYYLLRDTLDDVLGKTIHQGIARELQECFDPIVFGSVLREGSNGIGRGDEQ